MLELIRILLGLETENYRSKVLELYSLAFMNQKIMLGETSIEIPFIVLLVLLLGTTYLIYYIYKSFDSANCRIRKASIYTLGILSVVFIVGMCVSYMFKFSEEEALGLAAFSRYLRIIFHCLWVFILSVLLHISILI